MSAATTNTAGDATQALQYAFEKLGQMAHEYGPKALDLALQVTQADAVASLLGGLALAAVGGATLYASYRFWRISIPEWGKSIFEQDDGPMLGGIIGGALTGVVGSILTAIAAVTLLDLWAWIGLFNPKLALAHEVLKAVASHAT